MLRNVTISNEVISIDVSRELGKLLQAQFEVILKEYNETGILQASTANVLCDIIGATGLKSTFNLIQAPYINAAMLVPAFSGHRGTGFTFDKILYSASTPDGIKDVIKIDTEKLKFSGKFVEQMQYEFHLTSGALNGQCTAEELTGLTLHEVGHAVDSLATLGDYVYLNYMLNDGIDVLLGNKRNVFKIDLLDQTYLEKHITPEEREAFVNGRTPEGARRAIISAFKKAPRGYLFDNTKASWKRDEQFADWFAARMGYARPLATMIHKMHKSYNSKEVRKSMVLFNAVQLFMAVGLFPLTLVYIFMANETSEWDLQEKYDTGYDRINKLRLELIAQLKSIKDTSLHATIMADIAAVDTVMAEYNRNRTVFDFLADLGSAKRRREKDQLKHEQNLETLLNNDLFITAKRYNS